MHCVSLDLTLEGVLADPMIAAAMRADRVDPRRFEALLRTTATDMAGRDGGAGHATSLPVVIGTEKGRAARTGF